MGRAASTACLWQSIMDACIIIALCVRHYYYVLGALIITWSLVQEGFVQAGLAVHADSMWTVMMMIL
jgi:hypothetical protein